MKQKKNFEGIVRNYNKLWEMFLCDILGILVADDSQPELMHTFTPYLNPFPMQELC